MRPCDEGTQTREGRWSLETARTGKPRPPEEGSPVDTLVSMHSANFKLLTCRTVEEYLCVVLSCEFAAMCHSNNWKSARHPFNRYLTGAGL